MARGASFVDPSPTATYTERDSLSVESESGATSNVVTKPFRSPTRNGARDGLASLDSPAFVPLAQVGPLVGRIS